MSRRDIFFISPLFVLFMLHGLLYYVFPEQHYKIGGGEGGWLPYLKYLFLVIGLLALVHRNFDLYTATWLILGCALMVSFFGLQFFWINEGNILLMQLQLTSLGYFFGPYLVRVFESQRRSRWFIFAVVSISFVAIAREVALVEFSSVYSRSGFRSIGPFVNPNNTGIVVSIVSLIYTYYDRRLIPNLIIAVMCVLILIFSGSKTAMILYGIGIFLILSFKGKIYFSLFISLVLAFNVDFLEKFWRLFQLREMSFASGNLRFEQFSTFLEKLGDASFFELLFGVSNHSLIDNAYLDMMAYGGVALVFIFLSVQIVSVLICIMYRLNLMLLLHALFFVAMVTTNVPRLWPTGYMYWALVSISILKSLRQESFYVSLKSQCNSEFLSKNW